MWQQKSLSAFLGTFVVDNKSHIQTMQHFRKKNQLVHSRAVCNYNAIDFHWGSEMYRIQLKKNEHLLYFVGDKEVRIKRAC